MKLLALTPAFSRTQESPTFVLTVKNDTPAPLDLIELLTSSSIVLNNKTHPNRGTKFVGNARLEPGQTHAFQVSLDTYLPGAQRKAYSPVLGRWRWNSALKPGKHTLFVCMGNAKVGPVEFTWEDSPLLYR